MREMATKVETQTRILHTYTFFASILKEFVLLGHSFG